MASTDITPNDVKATKKHIAVLSHPLIEAIYNGLFRFTEKEQALRRINHIKNHFIIAKEQENSSDPQSVRLWIKDYGVSDEEINQGYRGQFGEISIVRLEDGKYSLKLSQLTVPLSYHPQRTRIRRAHPDWGHPILRYLKKQPVLENLEKAHELLMSLHEEFPSISVPGLNYLLIMIYSKDRVKSGEPPVQKFKFSIVVLEKGGYQIVYKENVKRKPVIRKNNDIATGPVTGYFTSRRAFPNSKTLPKMS